MASLHNGLKAIELRKKNEALQKQMEEASKGDKKVFQIANFEQTTTAKIEQRLRTERVDAKRKEYEDDLLRRKQNLADLYNYEINQWRTEVLSKVETQEDRKARIMERAYALRDAREKERLRIVRDKLDEQWRDACDDARTLDSKAMTKFMNEQRLQQIQDKIKKKQELSGKENDFLAEWNRQLDELARKDKEKQDLKRRVDLETSEEVKAQIEFNARARQGHMIKTLKEDEEELARLRADIEREEDLQRQRQEQAYQRGREAMQFNLDNKRIRDAEAGIAKTQDKILLDYALRKEYEANMAEEAKRNANREAALQYKRYLEELMVKEAEDTAFVDEINKREEEKVWKARDDALKAREDARQYLMRAVDEGRQQQIQSKREFSMKEREEGQVFARKFLDEAAEAVQREKEEAMARRNKNVDNRSQLQQQIDYRKYREEVEKQEAYLAEKQTAYMERLHQQKLAEQGGMVRDRRPLQKNQWYS